MNISNPNVVVLSIDNYIKLIETLGGVGDDNPYAHWVEYVDKAQRPSIGIYVYINNTIYGKESVVNP